MKRFYKQVAVEASDTGYIITLDERPVKTPGKMRQVLPTALLAEAIAVEWAEQSDVIDPRTMHLTRLANTAIDRVKARKAEVVDEVTAFGGSDLLCYREGEQQKLVAMQKKLWDPFLDWARDALGAELETTESILHVAQAPTSLSALRAAVDSCDAFSLTALHALTTGFGSLVLGLAHVQGAYTLEAVWQAANLDYNYQMIVWGEDAEAKATQDILYTDMQAASRFLGMLT